MIVESQALCQSSATPHTQMCYKINVIHTTGLNSKAKSKKKKKKEKYLISSDKILLMKNFKSCCGVNQFYV